MKLLFILLSIFLIFNNIIAFEKHIDKQTILIPQVIKPALSIDVNNIVNNKVDNKLVTDTAIGKNKKLKNVNNPVKRIEIPRKLEMPNTQINSLNTEIFISKNKCSAEIKEIVIFSISNGIFSSITRRVSLDGSADSISGFKLASSDVMLKEAKIVKNCDHDNTIIDHPYICIIAVFEEEDLTGKNKLVEIEYEYLAENILKTKKKPFNNDNKQEDNVLIWIYDNYQNTNSVKNVSLKINFEEKFTSKEIRSYPEKYFKKINEDLTSIVQWEKEEILPNSYQNFSIHIPKFNSGCRNINEIHFELSYYSVLQFFMCFFILLSFIFIIAYIYINEKEKSESIKLNEEINNFKKLNNSRNEFNESNHFKSNDKNIK